MSLLTDIRTGYLLRIQDGNPSLDDRAALSLAEGRVSRYIAIPLIGGIALLVVSVCKASGVSIPIGKDLFVLFGLAIGILFWHWVDRRVSRLAVRVGPVSRTERVRLDALVVHFQWTCIGAGVAMLSLLYAVGSL